MSETKKGIEKPTSTMIELISEDKIKILVNSYMGLARRRWLSPFDIQELLRSDFQGSQVSQVEGFPIGGPNELYHVFLENPQRELVLKIVNKGAESNHDGYLCAREDFALKLASLSCLLIPIVYGVYPNGGDSERPYFIMECLKGQPMLLTMKELSKDEIQQIGREVGVAIASLHTISFERHGDLPVPEQPSPLPHYKPEIWGLSGNLQDVFVQRVDFIIRLYREEGILSLDDCKTLQRYFQQKARELLVSEEAPTLVQNDIDPKNILISPSPNEGRWQFVGLVDFDRSLAMPAEFGLGVMENRWIIDASEERVEIYRHFQKGFLEGYQPDTNLSGGWKVRMELFCALESLERIYNQGAREHLSQYILH